MQLFVASLDPLESKVAALCGTEVHWYAEQHGLRDMKQDQSVDSKELNIEGLKAELALAKILNVYPNFNCTGPTHVDLRFGDRTIDVKWTKNPDHNLAVVGRKNLENSADIFALMRGPTDGEMEFAGWVTKEEFFRKARLVDGYGSPFWLLGASELNKGPIKVEAF